MHFPPEKMTARLEAVAPPSLAGILLCSEPSRPDLSAGDVSQDHGIKLPSNLPAIIEGPSSWASIDGQPDLHIVHLDDDDIVEVDGALESFKGMGVS
jgi:hypothetical protein